MSPTDRDGYVLLSRAQVVIEARKLTMAHPGAFPALELALRKLYDAERARAGVGPEAA